MHSESGSNTLYTIYHEVATKALAASIRPAGKLKRLFSKSLAIKGAAPILSGTIAALTRIDVLTSARLKGIIHTISLITL